MDLSNITVNAQSSIRIAGDKILYFDPFRIEQESHDADYIFITHEHFDHFEPESISRIKKDDTVIIAPASMDKQVRKESGVEKVQLLSPGMTLEIDGLQIEAIPAYNGVLKPFHTKNREWLGYTVKMDQITYYVAGDTDVNEDIKRVMCDVALIPIGGKYTMDKKQAADYIINLKPQAVIPTHYGDIVGHPTDGTVFKDYIEQADQTIQVELR